MSSKSYIDSLSSDQCDIVFDYLVHQTPSPNEDNFKLSSPIDYGTLSLEDVDLLVERVRINMKRKETLEPYYNKIKQLPNGRYYVRVNGKKLECKSVKGLEDKILDMIDTEDITINSIFERYLTRRKFTVAPTTWQKDIRYYHTYIEESELGSKDIYSINLDDGYHFVEHCLKINPNMRRKYFDNLICCINQIFQYAIDERYILDNPLRNLKVRSDMFKPPIKKKDSDTIFSHNEQVQICKLAEEDALSQGIPLSLGIILLFNLALRVGELSALKYRDIEMIRGKCYLHVQREVVSHVDESGRVSGYDVLDHCKTLAGDRLIILNSRCQEIIQLVKEMNEKNGFPTDEDDFIFYRLNQKKQMDICNSRVFDARLRKYCNQLNLTEIKSCHDIRRTVITNLYEQGLLLTKISKFAGHSTVKQTLDYIRIPEDSDSDYAYFEALNITEESNIVRLSPDTTYKSDLVVNFI